MAPRARGPYHDIDIDEDLGDGDFTLVGDRGIYLSTDGERRHEELLNTARKKRRLQPSALNDDLATWIPVPDVDFTEDGARAPLETVAEDDTGRILGKRKQYTSTRDPMSLWRPVMGEFLDEVLRHAGLGDYTSNPRCTYCQVGFAAGIGCSRLFKCYECGEFLQCKQCCLLHHQRTPLHVIQEWTGDFWVSSTLADLGLVYQLGHGGFPCFAPDVAIRKLTIIEAPIIHEIRISYCKCSHSDDADNVQQLLRNGWYPATVTDPGTCATFRSLESYRLYNVVGNMNVRDFITSLERITDPTAASGMTWLPDRYKQFQRMARQWAFLMRLKRAGRGHDPLGAENTALGECAIPCWACPHDGRNLPEGWRELHPKYQFLYRVLLAVDANFRLKNRIRNNEIEDPSLGPGWGYWVEPQQYRAHLKKYVNEKDISTCIAFAALLQKDTRLTTGLRVSGVGGCVCARHECMRPNGLGDLQKGERYANMDYIVMAAVRGYSLRSLVISYDIGCQWKLNLAERLKKLPSKLQLSLEDVKVEFALPVWHAGSHNEECQNENSLSFKVGVGKSDGEGVERMWSRINPAAFWTKDAGIGVRADGLEGKLDDNNHLKNIGQGDSLKRKLVVAIAERDWQVAAFKLVSRTVEKDVKQGWRKMITDWEEDQTKPNPYALARNDCPTEAQVRLEVRKDEEALTSVGQAPLHGRSATAFLVAGIQIEDSQQRVLAKLKGTALVAADRENKIQEWRHSLLVKIDKFRTLQKIYMPGAARALEDFEASRDSDAPPPKAELVKLFMPSQMQPANAADNVRGCIPGLVDMEAKLRVAQCENSLASLRSRLHAKRHLISFRNSHVVGQVQSTKARTLIDQVGERAESYANRYRQGRAALVALKREAAHLHLLELRPEDIQLDGDFGDTDARASSKLAMVGSGRAPRNAPRIHERGADEREGRDGTSDVATAPTARVSRNAPGASRRVMSWIWTAPGSLDEEAMHESVRVEWSRALARKTRWCEEVVLLREEMRRVLRYLDWQSRWWREREEPRMDLPAAGAAGLRAYALKQAAWHDRIAAFFRTTWNVPAVTAAQHLIAAEGLDQLFSLE
ncbi:hypothetical protein C8R45DRAFT_1064445 [Mycena sanguinolenta]|nr:hypothetical protein C8R45DRAFT_1064445 [Mycena sanguinolenta]